MTTTEASLLQQFENVIAYDYEFSQPDGCRPEPSLLCGVEVFGEREWVYRRDQLVTMDTFPFPENALFIGGAELDKNFALAARNVPHVDVLPVQGINVYDILRREKLVLSKSAVEALEERFK